MFFLSVKILFKKVKLIFLLCFLIKIKFSQIYLSLSPAIWSFKQTQQSQGFSTNTFVNNHFSCQYCWPLKFLKTFTQNLVSPVCSTCAGLITSGRAMGRQTAQETTGIPEKDHTWTFYHICLIFIKCLPVLPITTIYMYWTFCFQVK